MNDKELIGNLTAALVQDEHARKAGMHADAVQTVFRDVLTRLRAISIPWSRIFQALPTILAMVAAGNSAGAIFAAVLAIFFPTPSVPAPAPTS